MLTSDILHTKRTSSLQVPLIKIGARQNEQLSFQTVPLIFHFALSVSSKANQQVCNSLEFSSWHSCSSSGHNLHLPCLLCVPLVKHLLLLVQQGNNGGVLRSPAKAPFSVSLSLSSQSPQSTPCSWEVHYMNTQIICDCRHIFECWLTCLLFLYCHNAETPKMFSPILDIIAVIFTDFDSAFYRYCIPSGVEDITNDRVLRLNVNAHPLTYINDQDLGTTWLSKIMTTQELDEGITITVDFANGQYQVMIHTYNQEMGLMLSCKSALDNVCWPSCSRRAIVFFCFVFFCLFKGCHCHPLSLVSFSVNSTFIADA